MFPLFRLLLALSGGHFSPSCSLSARFEFVAMGTYCLPICGIVIFDPCPAHEGSHIPIDYMVSLVWGLCAPRERQLADPISFEDRISDLGRKSPSSWATML